MIILFYFNTITLVIEQTDEFWSLCDVLSRVDAKFTRANDFLAFPCKFLNDKKKKHDQIMNV